MKKNIREYFSLMDFYSKHFDIYKSTDSIKTYYSITENNHFQEAIHELFLQISQNIKYFHVIGGVC